MNTIITQREKEIIDKKMKGHSLTQNEANILSKSIRPKLRSMTQIDSQYLLNKLEYNHKARPIENKIKKIILNNVKKVEAIIIYGSAIQTNYNEYNDIDVLVITKEKWWLSPSDKYKLIMKLSDKSKKARLNLDVQIIDKRSLYSQYPHNPSLLYQLKDSKVIYGKVHLPNRAELPKLALRMKLDWSDIDDEESSGKEIYQALRNAILVKLLLKKVVDNLILNESIKKEIGERLMKRLRSDIASKLEKRLVLEYVKNLSEKTDKEIREAKWEKIVL